VGRPPQNQTLVATPHRKVAEVGVVISVGDMDRFVFMKEIDKTACGIAPSPSAASRVRLSEKAFVAIYVGRFARQPSGFHGGRCWTPFNFYDLVCVTDSRNVAE